MKIGTRLPGFARQIGFDGYCQWLADNGFEAVDTPPLTKEIAQTCKKLGLSIGTCDGRAGGLLSDDKAKQREGLASLKKDLTAIARHGGHTFFAILLPDNPLQPRAKTFDVFRNVYPKVVEHAEKEGVNIAIEPWPGPGPAYPSLGCSPESLRRIFSAIPSPNLGICYDPSHFARLQIDYVRLLHEFGGRVKHVHLKDTEIIQEKLYESGILGESYGHTYGFGEGWWRYTIPGEGMVDWELVLRRLDEFGYDGVLSVELEDHHFWATTELQQEGILRARDFITQFLKGRD
ncbi:MAG: sugar phosphate isomerase/epimerase [Candidatus Latescibacteria bacterium]|nr:sugar phosphate isomerase/epimerase [Candidatus Latescibacterota bacterium]